MMIGVLGRVDFDGHSASSVSTSSINYYTRDMTRDIILHFRPLQTPPPPTLITHVLSVASHGSAGSAAVSAGSAPAAAASSAAAPHLIPLHHALNQVLDDDLGVLDLIRSAGDGGDALVPAGDVLLELDVGAGVVLDLLDHLAALANDDTDGGLRHGDLARREVTSGQV